MCPLDPKYLARLTGGLPIEDDRWCTRCRYNLIGLKTCQKCPECGKPIDEAVFGRPDPERKPLIVRDPGPFWASPTDYQRSLAAAATILGVSGALLMLSLPLALLRPNLLAASVALVSSLGWWTGACMITRPRRLVHTSKVDPVSESAALRAWGRILQSLWLLLAAQLLLASIPAEPFASNLPRLMSLAWFTLPVAIAALLPLVWHVSALGFWAGDTSLGFFMRTTTWLVIPGSALAFALTFTRALPNTLGEWGVSTVRIAGLVVDPESSAPSWLLIAAAVHALSFAPLLLLLLACFDLLVLGRAIRQGIRERTAEVGPVVKPLAPIETTEIPLAAPTGEHPAIHLLPNPSIAPPKKKPPTQAPGF